MARKQKPIKPQRENPDYNLNLKARPELRENLLSVTYLLPRQNVKKAAAFLYRDLLIDASSAFLTRRALARHLAGLSGAQLGIEIDCADRDYLFTFRISAPDEEYLHTFKSVQLEAIDTLVQLATKGYSRDAGVLKRLKKNAKSVTRDCLGDPLFQAAYGFKSNFLPKTAFAELPYGPEKDIDAITDVDLVAVAGELQNSIRFCNYVGKPEARICLKVKQAFKPTPFVPTLRTSEIVIGEPRDLKTSSPFSQSVLLVGFRFPNVKSESDLVILQLANEMLSGSSSSVLFSNLREKQHLCYSVDSSIHATNGLGLIFTGIDRKNYSRALSFIKKTVTGDLSWIDERSLSLAKKTVSAHLTAAEDSVYGLDSNLRVATYLGLSKNGADYSDKVTKITLSQLKSFFEHGSYIGSYFVEGLGE